MALVQSLWLDFLHFLRTGGTEDIERLRAGLLEGSNALQIEYTYVTGFRLGYPMICIGHFRWNVGECSPGGKAIALRVRPTWRLKYP